MGSAASLCTTTCPYCGVGCGVDVSLGRNNDGQPMIDSLQGSPEHPANHGKLCIKGSKLQQTNRLEHRLLVPRIAGQEVGWQQAIEKVAAGFSDAIARHGPDAVAFYVSGQLLTEDYYVANKLMKGYIGSANIDTNSRLCMSSAVAGYKRAFGADAMPCCYEDLEQTELLILVGSNAAWTHPVLYQRMERAKQLNPALKLVNIDPRQTATTELADLHLAIRPGTDVVLFNGLLAYLAAHELLDRDFIEGHTQGIERALAKAAEWPLERVANTCDLPVKDLRLFYRWFADSSSALSFFSMGVNQSTSGTDKVNAIINCHLASGKIGKPGSGPFSITGQPNAMGGREVGGLATLLAAHLDLHSAAHRQLLQDYWQSPTMAHKAGLPAVELFQQMAQGKIKALWIMGTNPMVSLPDSNLVRQALKRCELVVVSDCVAHNDTLALAHVQLPAATWSEKDGTVTNSERRISRQRGFLPPPGQAMPDWQILCAVARAMGFSGFDFGHPGEIFDEYARLTGLENQGRRALDISALAGLTHSEYDRLAPVQWPVSAKSRQGSKRLFTDGHFYTPDGRANFVALDYQPPQQRTDQAFPYVLNSGRIRDQWHTMTRTGQAAELMQHEDRPWLRIHPQDAATLGLAGGQLAALSARHCQGQQVILPVKLDAGVRRGELFAPMHWNGQFASHGAIGSLFAPLSDPYSFQPGLKHAAVAVEPVDHQHYGLLLCRRSLQIGQLTELADYWLKIPLDKGLYYLLASRAPNWHLLAQYWPAEESLSQGRGAACLALQQGRLDWALTDSPSGLPSLPTAYLQSLLDTGVLSAEQQSGWLRGEPDKIYCQGRQICSCFKVHEKQVLEAIAAGQDSVGKLGASLQCGTGCGSCKPELSRLLKTPVQPAFSGGQSEGSLDQRAAILLEEAV
ncbi:nitrate reductase [Bowmanella dokdonensis]|uniref:Nitrate reductase n=1 Tax=Bowmanella dokdonensis TaxID=751969 RepID=A0A939DQS4_9ALTE|nr:nitrate reductase [Bowmanella dokdonensis]MBN7827269.1 nitrate reductase [Bowmanella dokdonensis]